MDIIYYWAKSKNIKPFTLFLYYLVIFWWVMWIAYLFPNRFVFAVAMTMLLTSFPITVMWGLTINKYAKEK